MQQYLEYLGRQLRTLRTHADMTQAELAAKLGVNHGFHKYPRVKQSRYLL